MSRRRKKIDHPSPEGRQNEVFVGESDEEPISVETRRRAREKVGLEKKAEGGGLRSFGQRYPPGSLDGEEEEECRIWATSRRSFRKAGGGNSSSGESEKVVQERRAKSEALMQRNKGAGGGNFIESWQSNASSSNSSRSMRVSSDAPLIFKGTLHEAKIKADMEGKMVLANVQLRKQGLPNLVLNSVLWDNESAGQALHEAFIFWQTYGDTEEGIEFCDLYNLKCLPAIVVVDAATGRKLGTWDGKTKDLQNLIEDLVSFAGKTPLAKKRLASKRPHETDDDSSTAIPKRICDSWDEDRERLVWAFDAASVSAGRENVADSRELPLKTEQQLQIQGLNHTTNARPPRYPIYPTLPQEPDARAVEVCRVGVRFPDGRREQRKFFLSDPVQFLWSLCSLHDKAAAKGRSFHLIHAVPGSSSTLHFDLNATMSEAGVADSLLSLIWD
eukprot:c27417_g1_i1 orf=128-1459(+)